MRLRKRVSRPRWTCSKTQTFGVALIVLGALQANMGIFTSFLSEEAIGYLTSGIGIAVYILRAYTTKSVYDRWSESRRGGVDNPDMEDDYYEQKDRRERY